MYTNNCPKLCKTMSDNKYVMIVTILILILSLYKFVLSEFDELVPVKSHIDNREYYVQNLPDKKEASDNLAKLRSTLIKIVDYMSKKHPEKEEIKFLSKNFNPDKIIENPSNSKYTSYSINKGRKIVFCIRQREDNNDFVDFNTLVFVGIHELAHLMTSSVGHGEDFWNNMKFLLKEVIDSPLNVIKYHDYSKSPVKYCGTTITDSPYHQ